MNERRASDYEIAYDGERALAVALGKELLGEHRDVTEEGRELASDSDMLELAKGETHDSDKAAVLIALAYFDNIPKYKAAGTPIFECGQYLESDGMYVALRHDAEFG